MEKPPVQQSPRKKENRNQQGTKKNASQTAADANDCGSPPLGQSKTMTNKTGVPEVERKGGRKRQLRRGVENDGRPVPTPERDAAPIKKTQKSTRANPKNEKTANPLGPAGVLVPT